MSSLDQSLSGPTQKALSASPEGKATDEPFSLPPLREDLSLLAGPSDKSGAPTWTIFDPVRNRYFRLGHMEVEMLRRWHAGQSDRLLDTIAKETLFEADPERLFELVKFLRGNHLLRRNDKEAGPEFQRVRSAGRSVWWKWLVHNYLFIRIPLVRPDRFLRATQPIADALSASWVQRLVIVLGLLGLVLALRQWDSFIHTFMAFANWQGIVWAGAVLFATKVFHELAHAYTARRYGCRVPTMGVAFLVLYPVLYTDTSDSWRLTSRWQRLRIGSAGIRLELSLALLASFLWSFLPDGPFRSAVFLVATATWVSTLLINLNPFLRFDGYYLLGDWLDIANLQNRAFALTRWWLRESLFGWGDPAPEPFDPGLKRLLIVYGLFTWIYRLFLFLGIALVVYHLFFKVLGIALFLVEIIWFIGMPIAKEVKVWLQRSRAFHLNRNLGLTLLGAGQIIVLLVYPWDTTIRAPALWGAETSTPILTTASGRLTDVFVRDDQAVRSGEKLFQLVSPDLQSRMDIAQHRFSIAQLTFNQTRINRAEAGFVQELSEDLAAHQARIEQLKVRISRMVIEAPVAGRVRDLNPDVGVGVWLPAGVPLGRIVAESALVRAYVTQDDLSRVRVGTDAVFYPEDPARSAIRARVTEIDPVGADVLDGGYLAAPQGGALKAVRDNHGTYRLGEAAYRLKLLPENQQVPMQRLRGFVHIDGPAESWLARLWRQVAAIAIRESGF